MLPTDLSSQASFVSLTLSVKSSSCRTAVGHPTNESSRRRDGLRGQACARAGARAASPQTQQARLSDQPVNVQVAVEFSDQVVLKPRLQAQVAPLSR